MKASNGKKKNNRADRPSDNKLSSRRKQIWPAIMAAGGACGMMATPTSALELGDLKIDSSLGQPLRASIAYALNPHEQLFDSCVYLRPGRTANGLPVLSRASVSVADGLILLSGSRAIREPLLTMQVSIDCPYTAHLSREYTLMINPPMPAPAAGRTVVEPSAGPKSRAAADAPNPRPSVQSRTKLDRSPIAQSSRYLVQRGDSLSGIASRIPDRSIALWPAVDRIFAANPDAFIDGDVNLLKAGSWLDIPNLSATSQAPMSAEADPAAASANDTNEFTPYTGYESTAVTQESPLPADEAPAAAVTNPADTQMPLDADRGEADFSRLQPGDVVLDRDKPFVSPIGSDADATAVVDIPDTEIAEPSIQPTLDPAVQPVAVVNTGEAGKSWSWLMWLGGGGIAVILSLLLFGQGLKGRFGSVSAAPVPNRRRTDERTQTADPALDVDFQVPDASAQLSSITLDADFDDGSGLQDASDMDVAQDFGFSTSTTIDDELDMVLPESQDEVEEQRQTDIIAPSERDVEPTILDKEILPDEADYDLSMIVDATKEDVVQPDVTEKDLQAVQVDADEPESSDYTVNQDIDYKILEQDYEDELTATQALNVEIEKAAAELADRMDSDVTAEMTANLPENTQAENDDINETGTYAEVTVELSGTGDEPTVEMPSSSSETTVEMPTKEDDMTIDMEIESGKVDTKRKKKAS